LKLPIAIPRANAVCMRLVVRLTEQRNNPMTMLGGLIECG
jgi:hypothetical protein